MCQITQTSQSIIKYTNRKKKIIVVYPLTLPYRRVASQFFLVSPRDHFVCPVPSFSEMKEIGCRKVLGFQKNW